MKIDYRTLAIGVFGALLLVIGAGMMESQTIVPEPDYVSISSPSVCGTWSLSLVDCYTGNSGRKHCYYDLYYGGVKERGSMYSTSSKDGSYSTYTSTHGDNTLKLTGCGYKCWTYQCAVKCHPPALTWGNTTISESGLAKVQLSIEGGGDTVMQSIDIQRTQLYAYNGIEWIDISSQLDPTSDTDQTITVKWNVVDGETGTAKVQLANTCGYILDWNESESVTHVPGGETPTDSNDYNLIMMGAIVALVLIGLYIFKRRT